jgi:FixJ family two-component response regulator
MPGFTGAQVVEALQERDPAVKLVMLTGSAVALGHSPVALTVLSLKELQELL